MTPNGYPQVAEEIVNGAVNAQFTYGTWRISQNRSGVLSYYGYDGGGSVRELFSGTGAVTDTYDYDAFGNTVEQTGSTVSEFLYRGEQFDSGIGMYYLRARYYAPNTGRFLTEDKFEGEGMPACDCAIKRMKVVPAGVHHLFIYGGGDPVNDIDPTGNDFFRSWAELARAVEIRAIDWIASNTFLAFCVDSATLAFTAGEISNEEYQAWLIACAVAARN